nr:hypothetical protein [Candidatus Sigynarchaeota archaeon]
NITQRATNARANITMYNRVIEKCNELNTESFNFMYEVTSLDYYLYHSVNEGFLTYREAFLHMDKFLFENLQRSKQIIQRSDIMKYAIFNMSLSLELSNTSIVEFFFAEDSDNNNWYFSGTRDLLYTYYSVDYYYNFNEVDYEDMHAIYVRFNIGRMQEIVRDVEKVIVFPLETAASLAGLATTLLGIAVSLFALQESHREEREKDKKEMGLTSITGQEMLYIFKDEKFEAARLKRQKEEKSKLDTLLIAVAFLCFLFGIFMVTMGLLNYMVSLGMVIF